MAKRERLWIVLIFASVTILIAALVWKLSLKSRPDQPATITLTSKEQPPSIPTVPGSPTNPAPAATIETPSSSDSSMEATPSPQSTQPESSSPSPIPPASSGRLIIPVAGVGPDQLQDTFTASRSEGRQHDAIDIPAPSGTPVLAAADGKILKLFLSKPGGITIYQLSTDEKMVYYYAHLARYADGIVEGHFAHQGETIAYVGDTGNAGAGNYHLHFSISIISDPKHYWQGMNINPYPLLRQENK